MGDVKVATFTLDSEKAELGVQRMTKLMQLMNKTAADAQKEMSQMFVDVHGQMVAPRDKETKATQDGEKAVRAYRQERRLENYVIREGSQALMSMVFALSFLTQGEKDASNTTKMLMQSVMGGVIAMSGLEMTMFSVSRAFGQDKEGNLNKFGTFMKSWGGPIALAVAGLVTLISFLNESKKASKEAAEEGLKKYREELEKMTPAQLKQRMVDLQAAYPMVHREAMKKPDADAVKEVLTVGATPMSMPIAKLLAFVENTLGLTNNKAKEATESIKTMAGATFQAQEKLKGLKEMEAELAKQRELYELETDPKKRLTMANNLVQLEYSLAQAKKNSLQQAEDQVAIQTSQLELGRGTVAQLLVALDVQEKATKGEKEKLAIQQKRLEITEKLRSAEHDLAQSILEAVAGAKLTDYERQQAEALAALQKRLQEIEDQRKKNIKEGMSPAQANSGARQLSGLARGAYATEMDRAYFDRVRELALLKADNLDEEEQQVKKRYEAERQYIKDTEKDAELKTEKLKALDKQERQSIFDLEVKSLSEISQGFQSIEQGLTAIGVRSDSVFTRMIQMAQIAIKISQTLSAMNKPGADETSGWLSIIGSVLGIVGLFDSGGWTGAGSPDQVAGLVHKDEIVFEQPIVQQNRNELLGLRKSLQAGMPISAALPMADRGDQNAGNLVNGLLGLLQLMRMPLQTAPALPVADKSDGQPLVQRSQDELFSFRKPLQMRGPIGSAMPGTEKLQRNSADLIALRKSLQMTIPMSAAFPRSDNGGLNTAILVSEIRSLRETVRSLEIQQPIVLRGLLNGQKLVREELPAAQVYMSKKFIDKQ